MWAAALSQSWLWCTIKNSVFTPLSKYIVCTHASTAAATPLSDDRTAPQATTSAARSESVCATRPATAQQLRHDTASLYTPHKSHNDRMHDRRAQHHK